MPYDPNEVAKPRSLSARIGDKAKYVAAAPFAAAQALAGMGGMIYGGLGFLQDASNKALGMQKLQDVSYTDLANKAREREAAPMQWAKENLPFGEEAEVMLQNTIGQVFNYLNEKGEEYGQKNLEATGSPLWATIVETSFKAIPYLGAEALGVKAAKGVHAAATIKGTDFVPTPKEFRNQLATPKPIRPEVIPPTRFLNSQHLDLPETSNFDKPPITRDVFNQQMKDSFGITEEHASAVQAVVEARARQWANETGYLPQDYYPMFFDEIAQGGEHGPGALFQRDPEYAATWYSHLEKTVEGSKFPNKAPGADMAKALESWAAKGDIKPEELAWTGTAEWLKQQKGTVTKQQVLDHIRRNGLEIKELEKNEASSIAVSNAWDEVENYRNKMEDKYGTTGMRWQSQCTKDERAVYDKLVSRWDELTSDTSRTKFRGWKQGGGENYRELLMTLPKNKLAGISFDPKFIDSINVGDSEHITPEDYWREFSGLELGSDITNESADIRDLYKEFTDKYEDIERFGRTDGVILKQHDGKFRVEYGETDSGRLYDTRDEALRAVKQGAVDALPNESFVGSHWDEPNVLAHTRLTDRTDANGKKVLFVEEIQSDWHQHGRDSGYITQETANAFRKHHELENEMYKRYDEAESLEERGDMEGAAAARAEAERLKEEKYQYRDKVNQYHSGVPDAPMKSTKAWSMLAMKRLVRYAAEHGYDKIAWTTGAQQNKMYDLSSHIKRLMWNKDRYGNYELEGTSIDPNMSDFFKKGIPGKELHSYIGRELADKILNDTTASQAGVLRGLDLEVGGSGMKGFYDDILPNETKRMFGKKQWGNAEVGKTTLEFPDEKHNAEPRYEGPEYSVEQLRQMAEEHFGAAKTEGMALQDQIRHAELGEKFYRILNDMEVGDVPFGEAVANHVTRAVLDELGGRIRPGSKKIDSIDVHSMDVTPEMRQKALSEGMPLFSKEGGRIKGSTEFLANGKAIIRAYQGADVKTALHEVGHVFRSEIEKTNPKLMEKIKKDFDAQDGWHVKAEEDFTEAFLKWLETGERKNAFHENAFARFKNWLVNTYKTFAGKAVVGDAIKDFFDNTIRIKDIEKAEIEAKTIGGILDKYSPDNITDAAYITSRGKPVGNTTEGGHASTIENVTAEMGWHELFLNEDLGREETVRRTKLITRVAMEGENLFVTGESVMSKAEARAAVKRYITDARIEEAVLDYDGEQYVVKAGKFRVIKDKTTPKPKPERIKFQKPTKKNPLNNTDYKTPLREVIDKGKDIMSDKEYLRLTDEAMARGNLAAYDKAGLIRGVQATRRNTINQAKKFAADLKADLPNDIHWSVREVIERLRDGIDPTFRSDKREVSLRRTEKFLRKNTEMLKNMPTRIINLLRKRSIKDMTLEELAEIHHQIFNQENGLIKLGQLKFKLENAKLTRMREAEISKLGDSLGKSKDGKTYLNKEAISSHPLEVRKQTILDRVRAGYFGTLIPQQVFDILDGGANFGGAFHTLLYKHANRAVNYEMELARTSVDGGAAKLKQLGLDWYHWNKRSTVAGMDLSRQEMLQIHLGWMNPAYRQALRDTYSITDIKAADIEAALTKKELAFGNYVLEDYAKAAPLIDRTMQRTSNKTLKYETKYTPMMWAGDEFMKRSFEEMLNMEAGARDLARRAAPAAPFIKERVGIPEGDVKLDLRLVDNWLKNVVKRSHYISHAEYIKQIGTILSDQRVTRGIEQKFGMPAVDYLRNYVNDLANPSVVKGMQRWEQVSRLLRRNVASAYIAINPTSVAIQVASLPKYLKDAGLYNISSSLTKFILNPRKMYKRICDWEPQIRDRFFEREAAEMGELHKTKTGKSIDMLQSTGMWPTKMMDKIMVIVGYDATYNRFVNKIGHEAAKEKALEVTLRTQSATHVKDQAPLYKAGEAANWMTLFTNDLNKTWGEVIHTLPADLRAGRLRDAGYTMAGLGTMAIIAWYVGHQFTLPDSPADIADAFTEQALSTLPLVGNVAMAKKAGYDDTGNPAISALALPGKIASADSTKSKAKETFESASVLFGLPYTFTRKTAESIHEGSFKPYLGRGRENPFEKDTAVKTHSSRKFLGRSSGRGGRKFLK